MSRAIDKLKYEDKLTLEKFSKKFSWWADIPSILSNPYEALVLTDIYRNIIWVGSGFEAMTGYTANEALGLKPTFLQGHKTTKDSIDLFRENLQKKEEFEIQLTNHRKEGRDYECLVHIFPLKNKSNKYTHFLALERTC
ncbi:PAS domain-containing protein [Pleomorphovibrio marinus]|uniref:PAS domain-containing protein n=1 Tax=Pleomorphovibrio marinus TaxID=2164132 RepID=UPI00130034E5|nr:PAS domain-containing protein [Pleomorphovibrio marinus]